MKAPKTIFLFKNRLGVLIDSFYLEPSKVLDNVEYIRKDAFIKKACEWLKEHVLKYVPEMNFGVWKTDPDYYTKHFIEDFKNYIKGE